MFPPVGPLSFPSMDSSSTNSPSKTSEPISNEKMEKNLQKFKKGVRRWGITSTSLLPISSRGLPFKFLQLTIGMPIRLVQSAGPGFTKKMKEHVKKDLDWDYGIKDKVIDLESPKHQALRRQVIEANFRYAAYMYRAFFDEVRRGGENGILLSPTSDIQEPRISTEHSSVLTNIMDQLIHKMEFKVDAQGNFYSIKTGTMFTLLYDTERQEVVIGFMGLGNENLLTISKEERKKIGVASVLAAVDDWLGGIPSATLQVMKIGEMLKKETEGTKITPVIIGHSHGGGLAQSCALANGLKGIAFNPRPVGAGTRRYIGESKVARNAENITVFSGKKDWLSGTKAVNYLAIGFERVSGIAVPRNVGTVYKIPALALPQDCEDPIICQHVWFYEELEMLKNMQ